MYASFDNVYYDPEFSFRWQVDPDSGYPKVVFHVGRDITLVLTPPELGALVVGLMQAIEATPLDSVHE